MRIIGKKSDYYDPVQAYGLDENMVYVREEREIGEKSVRKTFGNIKSRQFSSVILNELLMQQLDEGGSVFSRRSFRSSYSPYMDDMEFFVIGFCGIFYPCVRITKGKSVMCFYPGDKVEIPYKLCSYDRGDQRNKESDEKRISRFLDLRFKEGDDIFHYFKTPILAFNITDSYSRSMDKTRLYVNPLLSDFKFYRVKDAYTAFQDIAQYLGGVLGDLNDKTVSISDKDMRDAKGFDDWSFKKRPSKHKP